MLKRMLLLITLFMLVTLGAAAQDYKTPQELADEDGVFLDIDGTSIYVQARGEPTDAAVILLHGFGGSTFTWRGTLGPLADAGYYAVALDLPPFGLSDKSAELDYSRAALADLVVAVMDALQIETAVIVGHSMGGGITGYVGTRHPERVSGLIFVSGGVFEALPENILDDEDSEARGGAFGLSIDPESPFAATLLRTVLTPDRFTGILESAYERKEVITEETIAGYQRPLQIREWTEGFLAFTAAEQTDSMTLDELVTAVEANDIPVLIVWGESDSWVSIALGETMQAALTESRMVVYEGVGHLPMEEDPEAFNADVIAFLQTIPR